MAHDGIVTIGIFADDSQYTRTMRSLAENSGRTINRAINAHVQPLGRITGEANEFQKSLAASNARVIAFGASAGAIYAVRSAFNQLVKATVEVEQQMTEINAIFQLGGQQLKRFSGELFNISNAYGMAFKEASNAAAEFARQGLTVEETLKRTSAAMALARISNMGMEQAVASTTSILNTFVKESLDAEEVVNRLAAVDQAYAVSSGDLAEALSRVSSSAADANMSLNETIGLITAAKQITARSASTIGNSLKTMFTRLQRPQVIDDLQSVGIQARSASGQLLPMREVLRNLANSYDGLAKSQKSFVAETVGGVYQINTLKAIMRDLGSGMSIVDGAMNAAANSTDFVQKRMAVLNETISSQLVRAGNRLTETFSNIGSALLGGTMRSGLSSFEKLVTTVGNWTDSSKATSGDGVERLIANAGIGALKGAGNLLKGPGAQLIMYTLIKLYQRLEKFLVDSARDLTGVNKAEKQRLATNESVAGWLKVQKDRISDIMTGQKTINTLTQEYVEEMKDAAAQAKTIANLSSAIGGKAVNQLNFVTAPQAARGFIPNLEIDAARKGGYTAGNIVSTTLQNGDRSVNVIANTAEKLGRVSKGGKNYDFLYPKEGSPAYFDFLRKGRSQTGMDLANLPRSPLSGRAISATGFVPNLNLSADMIRSIEALGINTQSDIIRSRNAKYFTTLPESLVGAFVNRYQNNKPSLVASLRSLVTRNATSGIPSDPTAMYDWMRGWMIGTKAKQEGLFPDMGNPNAVRVFAEMLAGGQVVQAQDINQRAAKLLNLRPTDIQKVLNLHGPTFPFIAAYEDSDSFDRMAGDRPGYVQQMVHKTAAGETTYHVPMPIYGHRQGPALMQKWKGIEAQMAKESQAEEPFFGHEIGTARGAFFEKAMRGVAIREGVGVGDTGEAMDIRGAVQGIIAQTNIGRRKVSGMEIKASVQEAVKGAQKVMRTLVGDPNTGGTFKGPTDYVPKLMNVRDFDMAQGGIGIIDADKFGEGDSSTSHYQALIYAAVASGKPIRVHYGPMTMGKTTAAERIVNAAGGLDDKGGSYVSSIEQIDSDIYKQFIINKTDRKNLDTGVFGLALSGASQVRAFYQPYATYQERREEMVRRLQERNRGQEGKNAQAIAYKYDENAWREYGTNIEHLGKKLGSRVQLYNPDQPFAAHGFIPNLAINRDWDGDEDREYHSPYDRWQMEQEFGYGRRRRQEDKTKLNLGKESSVEFDEDSGVLDIGGIYRGQRDANPWMVLRKFIRQRGKEVNEVAAGTIVGPKIPKVLQTLIQKTHSDRVLKNLKGSELTFSFSPSILRDEAVDQIKNGDLSKTDFKEMVQAMKFLGVTDFKTMRPHNFAKTLATGFVPNLAWPEFPDYTMGEIKGLPVRKSSMGISDDYFDNMISAHTSKITAMAKSGDHETLYDYLVGKYGDEYGKKIFTATRRADKAGSLATLGDQGGAVWNNLKGFFGERFLKRKLIKSGLFSNVEKLKENKKADFGVTFAEGGEQGKIEGKMLKKIGRYGEMARKFDPDTVNWLVGNDDTTTATGFVPNMALDLSQMPSLIQRLGSPNKRSPARIPGKERGRKLGEGAYGQFFDLGKSIGGVRVGKKLFSQGRADILDMTREYEMTRSLGEMKDFPSLFYFPKVVGKLTRALAKGQIGKEVFAGKSISSVARQIHGPQNYGSEIYDHTTPVGRAWALAEEHLQPIAHQELLERGIMSQDFLGHAQNTLFNDEALQILLKVGKSESRWSKLRNRMEDKPEIAKNVAQAMAKKNARLGIIDPGMFRWAMGRAATGFVPNLFPKTEIAEGSGYVPLEMANAFQLRTIAAGMGADPEAKPTEIASLISKHPIFKKLWMNGMFNFPEMAQGFVPNMAIDFDHLTSLGSYTARMKYMKSQATMLGKGSARAVFDIGEGQVVKLAMNDKGIAQNYAESSISDEENPILTKVFDADAMGRYIVAEKAEKLDSSSFKKMTGQTFGKFASEMQWSGRMAHRGGIKTTSSFAEKVKKWALRNDVMPGDLGRRANMGIVQRPDPEDLFGHVRPQPAIVDYGFTRDVAEQHYLPRRGMRGMFAKGFVPNLATNPSEALRGLFSSGVNSIQPVETILSTLLSGAQQGMQPPYGVSGNIQDEIARVRRYASEPGTDDYWTRRLRELTRRGNIRGVLGGISEGFESIINGNYYGTASSIAATATPDQRRALRNITIEFQRQFHKQIQAGQLTEHDSGTFLRHRLTPLLMEMFPPQQVFNDMLTARTPSKTELKPHAARQGYKTLTLARNSSELTVTPDKKLYVDFLRRNAWMHSPTGHIFEEANPLKPILGLINKDEITGIKASVIGAKIPNIVKQVVELAKGGKFKPGFSVNVNWTPSDLSRSAQRDKETLRQAKERAAEYKSQNRRPSFGEYDFQSIYGFMTDEDEAKMNDAMAYFGHTPDTGSSFYLDKTFAKGYIPNLYNAVSAAMMRENVATGGKAAVGIDPRLRTSFNPMGLAAYDTSSQSSVSEAIDQHMALGQPMSKVRTAHTARGFVPNLAMAPDPTVDTGGFFSSNSIMSSLMMAMVSFRGDNAGPTDKSDKAIIGGKFRMFYSEMERAAAGLRILERSFSDARNKLETGETVTAGGRTFRQGEMEGFDTHARQTLGPLKKQINPYLEEQQGQREKLSKIGLRASVAAGFGGGVVSQFVGGYGGDKAASTSQAIDELSAGASTAAQFLLAFPNKFGKIGMVSIAAGSMASAADILYKGIGNARKAFETSTSRFQALTSQIDAVLQSLNQYDNLITDTSVSFEAVRREQRKLSETLAAMADRNTGSPEGERIAARVMGAPDTKTKMSALVEERGRLEREQNLKGSGLALQEYASRRTFGGGMSRAMGVNPFGFGSKSQQTELNNLLRGSASSAVADMSDDLKKSLATSSSPEDFIQKLNAAASQTNFPEMAVSAQRVIDAFSGVADLVGGQQNMKPLNAQMLKQLISEEEAGTPDQQKKQRDLRARNAERQIQLETSSNMARSRTRMFINTGSAQVGYQMDKQQIENMRRLNQAMVLGPNSVSQRQFNTGLMRQQYGERTVKAYESATETYRVRSELGAKVTGIKTETTRGVSERLSKNFENLIKSPEQFKEAWKKGSALPTAATSDVRFVSTLNKALSDSLSNLDLSEFNGPKGVDTEGMAKAIVGSSGADKSMKEDLTRYLQATLTDSDTIKALLDANKQILTATEDSNVELAKIKQSNDALRAEIRFKEMANYLGGIKNLLDRGSRRTMERNLSRATFMMERGRTPEAKAMGGALFLQTMKEMNIPIEMNKNTPLSKMMKKAWDMGTTNMATVQSQMIGRTVGSVGRLTGGGSMASQAMQELAKRGGVANTVASFQQAFTPESEAIEKPNLTYIEKASADLARDLDKTDKQFQSFGGSLIVTEQQMIDSMDAFADASEQISKAILADSEAVWKGIKQRADARAAQVGAITDPKTRQDTWGSKFAQGIKDNAVTLGTAAITAAVMAVSYRRQGKQSEALIKQITAALGKEMPVVTAAPTILQRFKSRVGMGPKETVPTTPHWTQGRSMEQVQTISEMAKRAGMSPEEYATKFTPKPTEQRVSPREAWKENARQQRIAKSGGRPLSTYNEKLPAIEAGIGAAAPAMMETLPATEQTLTYKQRKGQQRHDRDLRRQAAKRSSQEYLQKTFADKAQVVSPNLEDQLVKPPVTDIEGTKIWERNMPKANPATAAGRAAISKLQSRFGKIRLGSGGKMAAAAIATLMGGSLISAMAGQGGGASGGQQIVGGGDVAQLGLGTVMNSFMMKQGGMSRLSSLRKGGALALTGLVSGKVGEAIGGTKGELAAGAIDIAAAAKFFGARGGAGAAIGVGSELLRRKFTEKKFGYTAGAGQGMAGAMLSGAAFGGPIGAAIGGGLYGVTEGMAVRGENVAALQDQKTLDRAGELSTASALEPDKLGMGNLDKRFKQTVNRLTGRKNELENRKEQDVQDNSGYGGAMMKFFHLSKNQYTDESKKESSAITRQLEALSKAKESGKAEEMLAALKAIHDDLIKGNQETPEDKAKAANNIAPINSNIKVDISVADTGNITPEMDEKVVKPLRDLIANLQTQVNSIINQSNPRPSQIAG